MPNATFGSGKKSHYLVEYLKCFEKTAVMKFAVMKFASGEDLMYVLTIRSIRLIESQAIKKAGIFFLIPYSMRQFDIIEITESTIIVQINP